MTQYSITLGQELVVNAPSLTSGDQVVVDSQGNGNALGDTLHFNPAAQFSGSVSGSDFIPTLEQVYGPLERGNTYVITGQAGNIHSGFESATWVLTETQSGKIGAIELLGVAYGGAFGIADHTLTLS
jgi:hypothetical protein